VCSNEMPRERVDLRHAEVVDRESRASQDLERDHVAVDQVERADARACEVEGRGRADRAAADDDDAPPCEPRCVEDSGESSGVPTRVWNDLNQRRGLPAWMLDDPGAGVGIATNARQPSSSRGRRERYESRPRVERNEKLEVVGTKSEDCSLSSFELG